MMIVNEGIAKINTFRVGWNFNALLKLFFNTLLNG
jgi:hypothetical protein